MSLSQPQKNSTSYRARRRLGALAILLLFAMNAYSASDKTLFDPQSSTNADWQIVNDDVMGGVSTSRFEVASRGTAVFLGALSLENNGGFASVRLRPVTHDVTGHDAFLLRVRGDGRRYKFVVRTDAGFDGTNYQCGFSTKTGEWEVHCLPLSKFLPTFRGRVLTNAPALDPAKIESIGFLISEKQAGAFRLEVGWIKAAKRLQE